MLKEHMQCWLFCILHTRMLLWSIPCDLSSFMLCQLPKLGHPGLLNYLQGSHITPFCTSLSLYFLYLKMSLPDNPPSNCYSSNLVQSPPTSLWRLSPISSFLCSPIILPTCLFTPIMCKCSYYLHIGLPFLSVNP